MNTQLIGEGADGYQGLWNLWWVKQSTFSLSNPYVTNQIFYPDGTDLYLHSLSPVAGYLSIPIQLTLGLVSAYNLLVIFSFVLGGYGMYRLAYHITAGKQASFFAGLVFTFSDYHLARAFGHLNLVSVQWIPFYVLFLLKMRQENSLKNIFFAVAFLVLAGLMADFQYILFLALFTAFYVLYELVSNRDQIVKFLMRLGIMTAAFVGVMFLVLEPLIIGWFTGKYAYAGANPAESVALSADLLSFFTPPVLNPFFGGYTQGVISHFSTSSLFPIEGITYIGYTVLVLALYSSFKLRKLTKFWLFGALAFMILSLGPTLHVLGSSTFTSLSVNVPLPELILCYIVPIFRVPSRIIVIATLCLAIVSAISLKHINTWFAKLKNGKVISLLFMVLLSTALLAETSMVPYPVVEDVSVSPFYYQLAKVNGTFSVLDLPQNYGINNYYMYYSTVSGKPLLGGAVSRTPPGCLQRLQAVPIVRSSWFGYGLTAQTDTLLQDPNQTNINAFTVFNIKYVILHRNLMSSADFEAMNAYLSALVGPPIYVDEKITSFEVPLTTLQGIFAYLSDGWWSIENGIFIRWMRNDGNIKVISSSTQYCRVSFLAGTTYGSTTLSVYLNGEPIDEYQIISSQVSNISLTGLLRPGVNELVFHSAKVFVPAGVWSDSLDTRQLSIFFENVEISPV